MKRAFARFLAGLTWLASSFVVPATANDILPFFGVYGDDLGCEKYFGTPVIEGIVIDRAGVEGNEWFCNWYNHSFLGSPRQDEWVEVISVDAVCFVEGTGRVFQGQVSRNQDGQKLRLSIPDVYPETVFQSCKR